MKIIKDDMMHRGVCALCCTLMFSAACAVAADKAKWISGAEAGGSNAAAPVLERTFTLDEVPQKAVLTLAVAGWHEVSVNGVRVGDDVLSPVTCQPDMRLSSVARDVASFLKKGENTVSVLLGNGWYNCLSKDTWGFCKAPWVAAPMICGELVADGRTFFVTDGNWVAYDSPIVFNALRNGEWYDARKEGRRENERRVSVVKYTPHAVISPEDATPCLAFDPVEPARAFAAADGGTIYDFGTLRAGWCEIEVAGEEGAKVSIDYDERLTPTNALLGKIARFAKFGDEADPNPFQHDEYTLAGRPGGERWHPRFTYHGFRYAHVRTKGKVELKSIKSVFVHSALGSAGSLETSDPVFSRLQDATRRSYLANFTGIPTDCPHREKNGWTGDTQLAMETGLWNFDAKDGYVHFLRMVLDAQRRNGQVPCILPCSPTFGYFWGSGPAYDAILFEIPWQLYRFYGDDGPARESYAAMKKYLDFIETKARADGLVEYGLGDWSAPRAVKAAPTLLTDSAYVYEFNRRVAFWAERFGESDIAVRCRSAAAAIKAAFNNEFYKGGGVYAGGELTSLAAPLYFEGLCADGEEAKVAAELLRRVREQGHKANFGILGAKWVPRVLAKYGFADDAWRIFTQPDEPGWAAWMKENDTLLESFDNHPNRDSRVHIMFGDISAWGYEYAAGIVPLEPGFKRVAIHPHPVAGVDSFIATRKTPFGDIRAGWKCTNGKVVLVCEVPNGIEAETGVDMLPATAIVSDLSGSGWRLDGEPVTVPHTWNAYDYDKGFADGTGPGDFRRKVDPGNSVMRCATMMKVATYTRPLPAPEKGKRHFVRFDGVCEKAVVRVNGRFAGRHVGAFTPFCFEITDFLQPANNQLEVEVDNRYDPEIPPASADFTMCGGIYRKVELVTTGMTGIDPTRPLKLWSDAATGRVRAEVPRLYGDYVTQEYDCGKVELWTPEHPRLYEVKIELDGDSVRRKVGFRTVEFRADGFYLNGVKRKVRGINRHQDMAGKGWALSPEDEERDFRLIKEMGCDAVRLTHYPQSENVYRLCDELGLLVWSEIPNVDYLTLTETYRQNALAMAREMIEWRGSHPCVAWWSCYNELYSSGEFKGEQPFKAGKGAVYDPAVRLLYDYMKSLDPTRPVVAASCRRTLASTIAIPDQVGLNVYPGWYGKETMADWIDIFLKHNPKYKCFAMTEYGAGSAIEQHSNPTRPMGTQIGNDHAEEYATMVHMADWRDMVNDRRLWGTFIWVWNDFGASDRYEGMRPGVNDKGVVSADRKTLKDVYFFYKANWTQEPMLHLCSKRMAMTTNGVFDVVAFSNLKSPVEVLANGRKVLESLPDEIASVTVRGVPLEMGVNRIEVVCGTLRDKMEITRK